MSARWTEADLAVVRIRGRQQMREGIDSVAACVHAAKRGGRTAKATNGFHSNRQAKRWAVLQQWERIGEITQLRNDRDHKAECTFELLPAQYIDGKCVERAIKYICDFRYINRHGWLVVEDVKGYREAIYRLKRKLMLHVHKIQVCET